MAKKRVRKNPDYAWITPDLRPLAVPIGELKPDPQNARTHDAANVKAIAASLREYGQVKPLVVNRRNGQIVAGNGTLAAARSLGWSHLAVVWVEQDESKQHGLSIADNRTAELAEWDDDVLAVLLGQVEEDTPELYADLLLADLRAEEEETTGDAEGEIVPDAYQVVIECDGEEEQKEWYQRLKKEGAKCRLLTL